VAGEITITSQGPRVVASTEGRNVDHKRGDVHQNLAIQQIAEMTAALPSEGSAVMQYARTPVRRLINMLEWTRIGLGIAPRQRFLLTVTGRRTGRQRTTPVAVVQHGSERWLVAPYGDVSWVQNARAAGRVWLSRGRRREECEIAEVSPRAAGPILREYVTMEPITQPFFGAPVSAPVAAFTADAANHPVFLLRSPNSTRG
jgi:deazaflavin-dependent oxidoreductase (nitroreductase family)